METGLVFVGGTCLSCVRNVNGTAMLDTADCSKSLHCLSSAAHNIGCLPHRCPVTHYAGKVSPWHGSVPCTEHRDDLHRVRRRYTPCSRVLQVRELPCSEFRSFVMTSFSTLVPFFCCWCRWIGINETMWLAVRLISLSGYCADHCQLRQAVFR